MKIVCKTCGNILGDFQKHGVIAMKRKAKSYNDYYFCPNDVCLKQYIEEGEGK